MNPRLSISLREFETRRCAWLAEPDADGFADFFHPALRFEHSTGRVDDAASFKEFVLSGAVDYHRVQHELVSVVDAADGSGVVVARGALHAELVRAGELMRLRSTTRAEFAPVNGGWRLLSLVCTAVPATGEKAGHRG